MSDDSGHYPDPVALKYGLPVEHVDEEGRRFCRHHPKERIPWHGHPCTFCWKAASSGV